ncbi:MAG: M23 family metallopeptidase [Roseiflexus sp.]|nr:M23 family metallopeptidase [Roseiflexus sp.]MCS7289141.1 M23 family metallopeptidase [Roseiflexus sp.]MDW8145243.1 M23 family metallopeptidase [Roseiflexaceae bacterium]MDW8233157.1 M23 family metallopeptidase [Roseiflexaceae bacterium]
MRLRSSRPLRRWLALAFFFAALVQTLPLTAADHAGVAPELWLPTPPGEQWRIIQGYACGTHNGWDRYSLDLVRVDGPSAGAPVRAAADGVIFVWARRSGTLILRHEGSLYTMYTHMQHAENPQIGRIVARGEVIGAVGDRGSPGMVHLHFTAFTAEGPWARNRRSVPLRFAEGYDLPEIGGCNQHGGRIVVASSVRLSKVEGIGFAGADIGRWYSSDVRIEFSGAAMAAGYRAAWGADPAGAAPEMTTPNGSMNLAGAGEGLHTLFVRGWDRNGRQTVATFGPIGYDITPPEPPPAIGLISLKAGKEALISWEPAGDAASGVAGYRIYIGSDPGGVSEWFVPLPEIEAPPLAPGEHLLRVQPIDYAGNAGEWVTIARIVAQP